MDDMYPLLVILGPTAAGKTRLSLELAREVRGEIISADSMQIYRGMDIGTAKASLEKRRTIKHHLIDIVDPDQEFSVADFQKRVDRLIPQIIARGHLPMLVGGTGLYIKAVVEGFLFPEMESDPKLRKKLKQEAEEYGNQYLHNQLKEIDPELADKLHPNDLRRIIRGIEVYQQTGKTITYFKKKQAEKPSRYRALKIGLIRDREELYARINKRVDLMIEEGLVDEVKGLLKKGYDLSSTALQGLGYKEIIGYLKGEYDLNEAIRILKRNTRYFAKRQLTWFKRDPDIHWFNLSKLDQQEVYEGVLKLIDNFFGTS